MPGRVLHVTEAMGGGITSAVAEMVAATPAQRHELLYTRRGSFDTGDLDTAGFSAIAEVGNRWQLFTALRRQVRADPPDVVHLHSAWAGLLGRLVCSLPAQRILYSPHSFWFERSSAPRLLRALARMVERLLVRRTGCFVAVGPYEAEEARALGGRTILVPNVVRLGDLPPEVRPSSGERPQIVMVGRLAPQKDPRFFREVVRALRQDLMLDIQASWIGAGDEQEARALEAEGIEVTGWLSRPEVLQRLRTCSIYVHTAAWEGNPMTVLEAAACGAPIVARSIPSLTALGFPQELNTPRDVAARVAEALATGHGDGSASTPEAAAAEQRQALTSLYELSALGN
jgi:glycosyltransferase involved in cell wall biosynthesis